MTQKIYGVQQSTISHNCGDETWVEQKAYASKEKAMERIATLKNELHKTFFEAYSPEEDEYTEESTPTSYEIERMDYYDSFSAEIIELELVTE